MSKGLKSKKPVKLGRPKLTASVIANVLVVAAIIFIPLMYGGTLSSAYQDPVENIGHIQAAVVNEDQPFTVDLVSGTRETIDVGDMLTDALVNPEDGEDTGFTWTKMDRSQAERDLEDASIRAILYIPEGLSEEVSQIGTTDAANTVTSRIELVTDDGINYLAGTLARSVAATLQDRVTSEASSIYAEALLESLGEVRTGMGEAADGATQLADGTATLSDGLQELDEGAATAADGSTTLSAGADELSAGLGQMASQVPELQDGVTQLADGSTQLAAGASSLNTGIDAYTDGVGQIAAGSSTLRSQEPKLQEGLQALEDGSSQLADGSAELNQQFKQISEPVAELAPIPGLVRDFVDTISEDVDLLYQDCIDKLGQDDAVCELLSRIVERQHEIREHVDGAMDKADEAIEGVAAAQDAMGQISAGASQVNEGISTLSGSVGKTTDTAANGTVLGAINAIDDGLTTLTSNSPNLRDGASQLASGSAAIAEGTGQLKSKVPTLVDGVNQLNAGGSQVADGAQALSEGLDTLAEGTNSAAVGSTALVDGSEELKEGLDDGVNRIPSYSAAEIEAIAQTSSTLIQVDPVRENAVNNSGAGFSPMFLSLALWIGGIAIYLVLPALDRRPGPGETWWMAAVRPATTAGVFAIIQAVVAVVFTNWLVELHAVNVWGMIGIGVLASLTFVAVNQACIAILGYRGRFVSIVLLLLQIASMGATFPVETMPAFFNWIHPWLPMTYTQLSFRAMIAGSGTPGIVGKTVLMLLVWLVVAVALVLTGAYVRTKNHPLPYDAALLPDNYPEEDKVTPAELAERKDLKKTIVEDGRVIATASRGIVAGHSGTMGTLGPRSAIVTFRKPRLKVQKVRPQADSQRQAEPEAIPVTDAAEPTEDLPEENTSDE